jgi:hypothetical protein
MARITERAALTVTVGIAALLGFAATASALPVANPSFESPVVAPGGSSTTITGWTNGSPGGGVLGPDPTEFTAPSGSQVAFTGPGNGAIIYQDTGIPVTAGATYTLSAELGQLAKADPPLYDYRLLIGYGGHDLTTTNVFTPSGYTTNGGIAGPILPGTFALVSNTGTAPAGASGDLLIFLDGGNANSFGVSGEALWDSVTLSVATVPEPGSLALLSVGLAGLAVTRRRRKPARKV